MSRFYGSLCIMPDALRMHETAFSLPVCRR